METPLLAVCLIVKDEEANLPGCLESIASLGSLVSATAVYDTGSTDATVEIAESAGCIVERGHWDGDFSRARNAASGMVQAKWLLYIDADERLSANVRALRAALREGLTRDFVGVDAFATMLIDRTENGVARQSWRAPRLYRAARTTFVGHVHERVSRRDGRDLVSLELAPQVLTIDHHGYRDEKRKEEKTRRNAALADTQLAALRAQGIAGERLVVALVDRGRSYRGHDRMREAIADLQEARALPSNRTYRWWGMEQLAECLLDVDDVEEAEAVVAQLRSEGAAGNFTDWLTVRCLSDRGRYREALDLVSGISDLTSALGSTYAPTMLLEAKFRLAAELGEFDVALAALIRLMVAQGEAAGRGRILLALWQRRPLNGLARILVAADGGHLERVLDELDSSGEAGRSVAASARELHSRKMTAAGRP